MQKARFRRACLFIKEFFDVIISAFFMESYASRARSLYDRSSTRFARQ